jgi:site-specific DNA-cytosine methylase
MDGNPDRSGALIAFHATQTPVSDVVSPAPGTTMSVGVTDAVTVRRLTPTEWERLQGMPDGWTLPGSNSRRYSAIGDAVTVPVAEWIGRRMMRADR